jgi:hypothetical protein
MKKNILALLLISASTSFANPYKCIAQLKRQLSLTNIEIQMPKSADGLNSLTQIENIIFSVDNNFEMLYLKISKAQAGNTAEPQLLVVETIANQPKKSGDNVYTRAYLSDTDTANISCSTNY